MGGAGDPWPLEEGPGASRVLNNERCLEKAGAGLPVCSGGGPQHQGCPGKPEVDGKDF